MMLTLGAALLTTMLGSTAVDTTVVVAAGTRLEIKALGGDVRIRTWDRDEVRIESDQGSRETLRVTRDGSVVRVQSEVRFGGPPMIDYRITLPPSMDLSIGGVNLDIDIEGTRGQVEASTVNGDVRLVGGSGVIDVSSVSGSVDLEATRGTVDAVSVSGRLVMRNIQGQVKAETVSGRLVMDQVSSGDVVASSVSGRLFYDGTIEPGGRYSFATHSGTITLGVPQNLNATLSVAPMRGSFSSTLPTLRNVRMERGERRTFTLGNGDAVIEVQSFSGRVRVGRRGEFDP